MHCVAPIARRRCRWLSTFLLAVIAGSGCAADDPATSEAAALASAMARHRPPGDAPGPLDIVSVASSRPAFTTDEKRHLLFELVLQNTSSTSVELARIDVLESERRAPLASYQDDALTALLLIVAGAGETPNSLAPGGVAIAYFDLASSCGAGLPGRLRARFTLRQGDTESVEMAPTVAVVDQRYRPLGPPLRGDRLLDANGCCDGVHRRALAGVESGLFLAQRFAIDFVRIDDRSSFAGDPARNESYFLFGAEVLAVASGRIVEASDGMAENIPTRPLPPFDIQTAAGNHVILALDDGRFALYAHLHTGTVRVRLGDRVERGQVLGLVGNTGNSFQPHLHFHVMDRASPLVSDGLPYTFDRFELQARFDITGGEPVIAPVPPPRQRRDRLPLVLDIIGFR